MGVGILWLYSWYYQIGSKVRYNLQDNQKVIERLHHLSIGSNAGNHSKSWYPYYHIALQIMQIE